MSPPPNWLDTLANHVAMEMHAIDILAPLGCHYYQQRRTGIWEIALFAAKTEIVGGQKDGLAKPSNYCLDLGGVVQLFDEVDRAHWQALSMGTDDELGPHIAIEGKYKGEPIWLRILAYAPARFRSGRYFKIYDFRLEDVW